MEVLFTICTKIAKSSGRDLNASAVKLISDLGCISRRGDCKEDAQWKVTYLSELPFNTQNQYPLHRANTL